MSVLAGKMCSKNLSCTSTYNFGFINKTIEIDFQLLKKSNQIKLCDLIHCWQ